MLPDRVSNPGPLTYESGALPIALRDPAPKLFVKDLLNLMLHIKPSLLIFLLKKTTTAFLHTKLQKYNVSFTKDQDPVVQN